jgi:eukaryotic-like serine/threonine-protein kinase
MTIGTPAFMPPEQAMGKTNEIDAQTDIWSAGATLFTLASGNYVHDAENAQLIMIRAATTEAPKFSRAVPDAPAAIADVIDRSLAFERSHRWPSAGAMSEALRAAAKAAFGAAPTLEVMAHLVEESRDAAPTMRHLPNSPTSESMRGRPVHVVEPATARPVATDSPPTMPRTPPRRSPVRVALLALGAAMLVGGSMGVLFWARSSSRRAATSGTIVVSPPVESAPPAPSTSASTTTLATSTVEEVPIDQLPAVRNTPKTPPGAAPAAAAPSKPDCNPPYTFDSDGNRKWKRECLR